MGSERGTGGDREGKDSRETERQRGRDTISVCVRGESWREYVKLNYYCSALTQLLSAVVVNDQTYCKCAHKGAFPLVGVADRAPVCCCLRLRLNK